MEEIANGAVLAGTPHKVRALAPRLIPATKTTKGRRRVPGVQLSAPAAATARLVVLPPPIPR